MHNPFSDFGGNNHRQRNLPDVNYGYQEAESPLFRAVKYFDGPRRWHDGNHLRVSP